MPVLKIAATIATFFAAAAHAAYTVTVDPTSKTPPSFSMELLADHGTVVKTRSELSQVKEPRCGTQLLEPLGPGRWRLPASCRRIEWSVEFDAPPVTEAAHKAALRSIRFPRWWSISDQTTLLHLAGDNAASKLTIRTLGETGQVAYGRADEFAYVPSFNDPPEFYAVGDIQETVRVVDGVRVRYVADDLERVTQRGLLDRHAETLSALRRLFPPPADMPFANELLVMLLGNADASQVTGAGGARSLIIDYPRDSSERDTFMRVTLAHEQFHQLTALYHDSASGASWPAGYGIGSAWLAEGLAHYYGLKTLQSSNAPADEKAKLWKIFVDPQRPVSAGLVELNRRFTEGDHSVYPLFYEQGATFFAELDRTLQEASGGQRSLDDFVSKMHSNTDGTLPEDLLGAWRAVAGERVDELVVRYVGS